jgi:streptogramin lyase
MTGVSRLQTREVSVTPQRLSMTLLTAALLASTSALAQTTAQMGPAALTGVVSSTQEGNMEGVLVNAKQTGSTITTTVVTDEAGRYSFPASRLQPGHYDISIRAVGYRLPGPTAVDVAAGKATSANIALQKVTDPHELGMQMNNAEWIMSMPRPGVGCVNCHTVHRIVYSKHTSDEWMQIIPRMGSYVNNAHPLTPQAVLPGPRTEGEAGFNAEAVRRTADFIADINLSKRDVWNYELKTLPRPKGRATRVIVTTYDLPRAETMAHDAITTPDGRAWYSDFGHQYIGSIDPATGKVTEYRFPVLKPRNAKGFLQIDADADGNVWGANMHQGAIGKVDGKTGKVTVYPIPSKWQSNNTQESMISPENSHVDGKVWSNNQDMGAIVRLDIATGKFEDFGPPTDKNGVTIRGYGQRSDAENNLYIFQMRGQEIGRIDAKTKEVTVFRTQRDRTRPRRGRVASDGKVWFALNGANGVGSFDPATRTVNEWILPVEGINPYDATPTDKGEVWTGGEYTDYIARFNPETAELVNYLMPIQIDVRRVFFDNARNTFWVGSNNSPHVLKVEALD